MASRDYGHGTGEVDSGELWLPSPSTGRPDDRCDTREYKGEYKRRAQREPRLSQGREKRAVRLLLLALPRLMDREMVWMSPQLRSLSPAMRVKIIYELEKLGAQLAQM